MPRSRPSERSSTPKHLSAEASPGRAAASAQPGPGSATEELETLYAALDNIENGVMLLDHELRARYANPALHTMFKSSAKVHRRQAALCRDAGTCAAEQRLRGFTR